MNNVEYLQNRQPRTVILITLKKINNSLRISSISSPVDQSCIRTVLPSALKQVNMKTNVDTMKRMMTILV